MHEGELRDLSRWLDCLPQFSMLTIAERETLMRATGKSLVDKGKILFQQGDPCTGLYLLLSGQIKLAFASPQGQEKVLQVIRPGESFCEAMLYAQRPYAFFAQAVRNSLLLHINKQSLHAVMASNVTFMQQIMQGVADGYHQLIVDFESVRLHSASERIVRYLLLEMDSTAGANSGVVNLDIAKGLIASQLNLTQEHFSRILSELHRFGLIVLNGRRIEIPAVNALQAYVPANV
ncbi:Crp/Fnr family transcriptional regulator [Azonexus sp.]|uniref:Crp/Fnr family transcriptional regulator n=1 Tax=Azonexus sp. TaxID=1872668 RepID=UPI0039E550A1